MKSIIELLDWSKTTLIPAIIQDFTTKEILMLAFMNKQALEITLQTKQMHYFSRSKQRIWKKGEVSGNIQELKECYIDCDNDSLLFLVHQNGAACHTGNKTCFFKKVDVNSIQNISNIQNIDTYNAIDTLYHILLERKNTQPNTSYTASLYDKGENAIGKKIIEEASEVVIALKDKDDEQIIYECTDLVYHTLVALAYRNIHPDQINQEIVRRLGISGLEEKANRK